MILKSVVAKTPVASASGPYWNITGYDTTGGTISITPGVTDPDSGSTAFTITGGAGYWAQSITVGSGQHVINSFYCRRRTGTGIIYAYTGADATGQTAIEATLTSSWQLITLTEQVSSGGGSNYYRMADRY